jgi:hypothetical protein
MTRHAYIHALALSIKQQARIIALRRLAEQTARDYDAAMKASDLPREHFELRRQLLGPFRQRDQRD